MLTMDMTYEILSRPKANQKEKIKIEYEAIRKYFPRNYGPKEIQQAILTLVEREFLRKQKEWERDSR